MPENTIEAHRFANGLWAITKGVRYRVEAANVIVNEDWKTALAHKQRAIQKGEQGVMTEIMTNFYGIWAVVDFDDVNFSLYVSSTELNLLDPI